jgi:voltage-gated potassium channel
MTNKSPKKDLVRGAIFLSLLIFVGTVGFSIIENWELQDAFYMTVITVSTVGYGEVHPQRLTGAGRLRRTHRRSI